MLPHPIARTRLAWGWAKLHVARLTGAAEARVNHLVGSDPRVPSFRLSLSLSLLPPLPFPLFSGPIREASPKILELLTVLVSPSHILIKLVVNFVRLDEGCMVNLSRIQAVTSAKDILTDS